MPPKKFTQTQLRVTDMHESDDTLQAAASTAKCTTATFLPDAEIEDHDDVDNDFDNDPGDQGDKHSVITNGLGDLHLSSTDADHLDVVTWNRLILEMLLKYQAQLKAEERLKQERMAAEWE